MQSTKSYRVHKVPDAEKITKNNERSADQIDQLDYAFGSVNIFKLHAAWSDCLENYISGAQRHLKSNLHIFILCINVIISYSLAKNEMFYSCVVAAILEITQDALHVVQTLHFNMFLLNIQRFKLQKR